jgi:hypothetical protein
MRKIILIPQILASPRNKGESLLPQSTVVLIGDWISHSIGEKISQNPQNTTQRIHFRFEEGHKWYTKLILGLAQDIQIQATRS